VGNFIHKTSSTNKSANCSSLQIARHRPVAVSAAHPVSSAILSLLDRMTKPFSLSIFVCNSRSINADQYREISGSKMSAYLITVMDVRDNAAIFHQLPGSDSIQPIGHE